MASSIETVPLQFLESLRQAGIDNLLDFLSKKPESELRLHLNQQRGDPELTSEEKLQRLRSKLGENPGSFLHQFGKYLEASHLECFKSIRDDNYEVDFHLKQMEISTGARSIQIKNRRYEALQKLVDTSDYFTEEEMQRRNPILYNQLVGRYHTKEEREFFLYQSSKSSSAVKSGPSSKPTPLTDMLIAHMNRREGICSDRRIDQEMQVQEEKQADREYTHSRQRKSSSRDDDSMYKDEVKDSDDEDEDQDMCDEEEPEIDEAEKDLLKEEFFTTMYRHFLEGKDEDFSYETVDDNPEYDVGETLEQDEEEKYFDSEEPQISQINDESIMSPSTEETVHNESDESAAVTVTLNQNSISDSTSSAVLNSSCTAPAPILTNESDEEDELDSYMKEVELELKRHNQFIS